MVVVFLLDETELTLRQGHQLTVELHGKENFESGKFVGLKYFNTFGLKHVNMYGLKYFNTYGLKYFNDWA